MIPRLFLTAALAAALAACATTPALTPGSHLVVTDQTELPPPGDQHDNGGARPYRIGAFDKLSVNVFGVPELSQSIQADASGRLSFPLVGEIDATGKTPGDLASELRRRLRAYIKDPQVTVNLEETVSQVVTVDGQVREPGLYPVVGRMTLMRAVASARGTTEFARLQDVVVFRTVGKQDMAALYNLEGIRRGLYADPEIYPSDVIVVGDSPARRLFRDILALTPVLLTPLVAVVNKL